MSKRKTSVLAILPTALKERLKAVSVVTEVSMNQIMIKAITRYLDRLPEDVKIASSELREKQREVSWTRKPK